jgi:hypothetical protein
MSSIIDAEPSRYKEAAGEPVWREAMTEYYNSILKNALWEIRDKKGSQLLILGRCTRWSMQRMVVFRSIRLGS